MIRFQPASNAPDLASNTEAVTSNAMGPEAEPEAPAKKQRWARDAYNAYMRDYMRKRRASA